MLGIQTLLVLLIVTIILGMVVEIVELIMREVEAIGCIVSTQTGVLKKA